MVWQTGQRAAGIMGGIGVKQQEIGGMANLGVRKGYGQLWRAAAHTHALTHMCI